MQLEIFLLIFALWLPTISCQLRVQNRDPPYDGAASTGADTKNTANVRQSRSSKPAPPSLRLAVQLDPFGTWRVFNQLSEDESEEVLRFLVDEVGLYHTTKTKGRPMPTTAGPNFVHRVELMEPDKDEVLVYLDDEGPEPERFAKVIVVRPESRPKDIMEYKVGPLPLTIGDKKPKSEIGMGGDDSPVEGVVMLKLREDGGMHHHLDTTLTIAIAFLSEILFYKRPAESVSITWTGDIVAREAYKLKQIFKDTVGWCYGWDNSNEEIRTASEKECGLGLVDWLTSPAIDRNTSKR